MSLVEILTLNVCEARDGALAAFLCCIWQDFNTTQADFVSPTDSLTFVSLQKLHILHEGVHVSHGGRE